MQNRDIQQPHYMDIVPEYLQHIRRHDSISAHNMLVAKYGWQIAERVEWHCLHVGRVKRINGLIVAL